MSVNAVLLEREYSIHDPCNELAQSFRVATARGRLEYQRRHKCTNECTCADDLRDRQVDDRLTEDHQ